LKKSKTSTSLKRLKKVGTSQVIISPELSTHLEEDDASKQGRNEDVMGSGEAYMKRVESAQVMNEEMASGEVQVIGDMDVESPEDAENFVVTDQLWNEVVMEKVIATQEKVVEKLKTLEPEQLVKATGVMGEALKTLGDSMVKEHENAAIADKTNDSTAAHDSAAKDPVDSAASGKVTSADAQDSAAGSSDNAAAEAMVLLSKKTLEVPCESSSKHTPLPTP
jgi:hypothetical protein